MFVNHSNGIVDRHWLRSVTVAEQFTINKILLEWNKKILSDDTGFDWVEVTAGSAVFFLTGKMGISEKAS